MEKFSIKEFAIVEFDGEMVTARKILERVPFDKFGWKPHDKSTQLGRLAIHVATLPGLGMDILTKDELVFDGSYNPPVVNSTEDMLKVFDEKSAATRVALEAATDESLASTWSFIIRGNKVYEGSRFRAFQIFMMNHLVHHRAQLGVYLRLNDVEIPGSYGPSADEPM
jgi:uncharacterized damage-inducible protein DinB